VAEGGQRADLARLDDALGISGGNLGDERLLKSAPSLPR
jgi:hypothetical protein